MLLLTPPLVTLLRATLHQANFQKRGLSDATRDRCGAHSEPTGPSLLWWQSALQFPIVLLQYEEGLLPLAAIRDEPLAVEIILKTRQSPARTPKVLENPRRHSPKKGNALQHGNLVLVQILLVLLGPASGGATVVAVKRIAAVFAHDQRLII